MTSLPSSGPVSVPETPFHVLMLKDGDRENIPFSVSRDRTLKRDWLSRRDKAFQDATDAATAASANANYSLWSGASPLEQALAGCCEVSPYNQEAEEEVVQGALIQEKAVRFVGLLALHCHDIETRALALAILERTLQEDDLAKLVEEELPEGASIEVSTAEPPPRKRTRVNPAIGASESTTTDGIDTSKAPPPDRMDSFLAAGGLRILSRWLVEATTPVVVPKPKPPPGSTTNGRPQRAASSSETTTKRASTTGPLLLPLLKLLTGMTIDLKLVKQSKIHKEIRDLGKQVDAIVQSASTKNTANLTDPVVGGLPVTQVQRAVQNLMERWKAKQQEATQKSTSVPDPFAGIHSQLRQRLDEMISVEQGQEKPEWLTKLEESKKQKEEKRARKGLSTEELAKREREAERKLMMKEDLAKAAKEKAELLQKLRKINQEQTRAELTQRKHKGHSRRGIKWKDGLGAASKQRKRELLEEVHVFVKDDWGSIKQDESSLDTNDVDDGEDIFGEVSAET